MHIDDAHIEETQPDGLEELGWSPWFDDRFTEYRDVGLEKGRVTASYGRSLVVRAATSEFSAEVTGRLRHDAASAAALPTVGDWVALQPGSGAASIHAVLERRTSLSRKAAGELTEEQVLAANLDLIFIVGALSNEPNLRRLERYLTVAWESGAAPVVLLTKADLSLDPESARQEVEEIAPGVPVLVSSSLTGEGIELVRAHLRPRLTAVLIGPSGAGKSSIINRLTGGEIRTQTVRDDGRGRHTTTHRELLMVPGAGMIIDTPGLREVQLWHSESGLAQTFTDIEQLAAGCRFNDCRHQGEPGCLVRQALDDGRLAAERFGSYRKLERELRSLEVRGDHRLQIEERKRWAAIHREARARSKRRF